IITLWRAIDDPSRAGRAAAILTLVGLLNLPVIKFSVECLNTLHQPASVVRFSPQANALFCKFLGMSSPSLSDISQVLENPIIESRPTIESSILWPLAIMGLAFTLLFFTLHLAAMRNEIMRRRVRTLMILKADSAALAAAAGN